MSSLLIVSVVFVSVVVEAALWSSDNRVRRILAIPALIGVGIYLFGTIQSLS